MISRTGRFPEGGNGNLFQYSYLKKPMDRGAWQAIYSPWSWKESDKHTSLFLSLALIKKLYHWCRQIFSSPLSDVPNYTSNILIGSVELAVRCPLIHFVISFSETRAMFWKVHAVLKDNNLKWLRWLVPLFPYSCFCCFSNDWFCNHWVLLDKWKYFNSVHYAVKFDVLTLHWMNLYFSL